MANVLKASAGSWVPVLWIAGALPIIAAVLAKFVLSPMRRRMLERIAAEPAEPAAAGGVVTDPLRNKPQPISATPPRAAH